MILSPSKDHLVIVLTLYQSVINVIFMWLSAGEFGEFGEFDSPSILRTDGSNWLFKWSATFVLAAAICFSGYHGILWVPISNPLLVGVWSFPGIGLDPLLKLEHVKEAKARTC